MIEHLPMYMVWGMLLLIVLAILADLLELLTRSEDSPEDPNPKRNRHRQDSLPGRPSRRD